MRKLQSNPTSPLFRLQLLLSRSGPATKNAASIPPPMAPLAAVSSSPWSSRRRRVLLAVLTLSLLLSLSFWIFYVTTGQAISKVLPSGLPAVNGMLQPHYLFSINGVAEPYGVAVAPAGDRIYVVEGGGEHLVRAFDRDGQALFAFATPDTEPRGRRPVYVTVDNSGLVYVTERLRSTIDVYDAGGNYVSSIKSPFEGGWAPLGVRAIGDHLLVTDVSEGRTRVLRLTKDGQMVSEMGHEGQEESAFYYPNSVTEDVDGRVFVSDGNNARVQVLDQDGSYLSTLSEGFSLPRGMDIDSYGRLHVVDTIAQEVVVFDARGDRVEKLFTFGGAGLGDGEFAFPNDIAIDDDDRAYISDRENNRVQVWVY